MIPIEITKIINDYKNDLIQYDKYQEYMAKKNMKKCIQLYKKTILKYYYFETDNNRMRMYFWNSATKRNLLESKLVLENVDFFFGIDEAIIFV